MIDTPTLIRSARAALGLTQQQLGERIGYTGRTAELTVQAIESGRRKVPRDKLQKLAELIRVPIEKLL